MSILDPILEEKVNALKKRLRTVDVDGTPFYVAEGDLLVEEQRLPEYVRNAANVKPPNVPVGGAGDGLLGIEEDGKIVRWPPGFVLGFAVLKSTFPNEGEYATVCENMKLATKDWEETCGVSFRHAAKLDAGGQRGEDIVFVVRKYDARGSFLAASFFPNDPPSRRMLLVDPSYFEPRLTYDPVGVLRHELGHVLGFRHEHIRSGAPPACPGESLDGTIDLTAYDPRSVMHYFCGRVGSRELAITDIDREGSQKVYGPPLARPRIAA